MEKTFCFMSNFIAQLVNAKIANVIFSSTCKSQPLYSSINIYKWGNVIQLVNCWRLNHLCCSFSSWPWTRMDVCLAFTFHLTHSLLPSRVGLIRVDFALENFFSVFGSRIFFRFQKKQKIINLPGFEICHQKARKSKSGLILIWQKIFL